MSVVVQAIAVLGVASLGLRFRRSRGEERQQLKWFAYAGVFYGLQTVVLVVGHSSGLIPEEGTLWLDVLDYATSFGLLAAIAIAVLKYRLYDIDRLINRTVVYGLLTALLGVVYAGVVLGLGQLFGG
jgi:heme A synthase